VRLRRTRYATYAALPRLPSRLETRGPITDPLRFVEVLVARSGAAPAVADPSEWHGIGAAVGRVRAACLPVLEPARAEPEPGRIIVARSTDPGWVPILVGAAGLAVEQGGLLSHSAIVARELGIPTVVGVPGLFDRVHDGDVLELDGWTGVVRLVSGVATAP
jgi:rifampicin phosphotransferase